MTMETLTTRQEHLDWCKKRALDYCDTGDVIQALASLGIDLDQHPETANHAAIKLGMMLLMCGQLNSPMKMRKFIEEFD